MDYNALVLRRPFDLRLKEVSPKEKPHVKMLVSGVCGTDKHAIKGDMALDTPLVLGHENVGLIKGSRVTWPAVIPCDNCESCRFGFRSACEAMQIFGITTTRKQMGGWAEYTMLPKKTRLFVIPDSLDDLTAVLIESMASTKALRRVILKEKSVLIIGSGPIGLLSAIHARERFADRVEMTGHRVQAVRVWRSIDRFYEKNRQQAIEQNQYDCVVDAAGTPKSFLLATRAAKPNGSILEMGCVTTSLTANLADAVHKNLNIVTQLGYLPEDFRWATRLVEENRRAVSRVITHKFRLTEYKKALDVMLNKRHGKIIFVNEQ